MKCPKHFAEFYIPFSDLKNSKRVGQRIDEDGIKYPAMRLVDMYFWAVARRVSRFARNTDRWAQHSGIISPPSTRRFCLGSYMLVRHKVRDFATWKAGYDAHVAKRVEAGLTEAHLLRGAHDPNEVVLLFRAADLGRAKAFAESPDLRETMQKVGVLDRPDIHFLND